MAITLSDRERKLLDLLSDDSDLSVNVMSENLGVSPATVRNDLNFLTEKGFIVRMRGKSIPAFHPDLLARQRQRVEEKKRIARAAASLIEDGDTVIIDTGTTAALIPRYLLGKRDVHIVTNSMLLLPDARINPGLRLTVVGGEFRPAIDCLVGRLAIEGFSNFHVRRAFVGTTGFTIEAGITNMLLESAEVIREMCNAAERVVLVADSTKYGRLGFAKVVPLSRVHQLITDSEMSAETIEAIRAQGLEVIAAVVIGGASVFGGKGTVKGTFLGVLLFAVLNNGLTLLSISSYWYNVTIGVIITAAITISAYQQLRQGRKRVNVKVEA